jgi:hypothetical protein
MAINGKFELSEKVFRPIYNSLKLLKKTFETTAEYRVPQAQVLTLTMLMGALFNNRPKLYRDLQKGKFVELTGANLYVARRMSEATPLFFQKDHANVDLRKHEDHLHNIMLNGMRTAFALKENGLWEEKIGKNRTLLYILIGLSCQGKILYKPHYREFCRRDPISYKRIERAMKKHSKTMRDLLHKGFYCFPDTSEQQVVDLF